MNKKAKQLFSRLLSLVMLFSVLTGVGFYPNTVHAQIADNTEVRTTTGKTVVAQNDLEDIELMQTAVNETKVTIRINDVNSILDQADSLKLTAKMYCDDIATQTIEEIISLNTNSDVYTVDFENFGKYTVETEYLKDNNSISKSEDVVMGIAAEEYNLALLNASFPVALFTLSVLDGITINAEGKNIPTFVAFERQSAWNWNSLPQNVYKIPTLPQSDYNNTFSNWTNAQKKTASYVKDLYEISPNAFFHLYTVDNYVEHIFMFLVANQIPEEQYNVVLLSDGSGTYSAFNATFQNDNGAKYNEMLDEWKNIKTKTKADGKFDPTGIKYLYNPDYQCLQNYPAIAAADENVEWWVARTSGTFSISNSELLDKVTALCTVKNLSTMLTSVQNNNKTDELKALYRFNNDMFSAADTNGKPVMLILGSKVTSESNFEDYAKMVMKYYGDTYEYYYKGHPGTPTILYPSKQEQLERLGITDVDSSIPAELILFFFPNIYMCGYDSTTFQSVESEEMACGMFNMKKATGLTKTYGELLDFFSSSINSSDETYGKYCVNPEHTYYLLEFNDTTEHKFAIYDAVDNTFAYDKDLEPKPEKKTPVIVTLPTANPIKEGQSLKDSLLSGGSAKVDETDISGSFQWKDGSLKPSLEDSKKTKYAIEFIPSDTKNYTTTDAEIVITVIADNKGNENSSTKPSVKKGDVYKLGNGIYKVTSISTKTVSYTGCKKNSAKTVKIPNSIKIDGKIYKVTTISANALKNNKRLQKVTIGSNITSIGKNAFHNCKKLKKIIVNSKKLKSVSRNALKGISPKAVIRVPKSKINKYKKLFVKKTGYKKTMKIK